jgi:hypothetical protein
VKGCRVYCQWLGVQLAAAEGLTGVVLVREHACGLVVGTAGPELQCSACFGSIQWLRVAAAQAEWVSSCHTQQWWR